MKKQLFLICNIFLFAQHYTTTETHQTQVMTDEQKEEIIEQAIKESFGQVISNMIIAAQHPESAPQCLANMVQSFLNLVFVATKYQGVSKNAFIKEILSKTYHYIDAKKTQELAAAIKKAAEDNAL